MCFGIYIISSLMTIMVENLCAIVIKKSLLFPPKKNLCFGFKKEYSVDFRKQKGKDKLLTRSQFILLEIILGVSFFFILVYCFSLGFFLHIIFLHSHHISTTTTARMFCFTIISCFTSKIVVESAIDCT